MAVVLFTETFWGRDVLAGSFGWGRRLAGGYRVTCVTVRCLAADRGLWVLGVLVCGLALGFGGVGFVSGRLIGRARLNDGIGGWDDIRARLWIAFPVPWLVIGGRQAVCRWFARRIAADVARVARVGGVWWRDEVLPLVLRLCRLWRKGLSPFHGGRR